MVTFVLYSGCVTSRFSWETTEESLDLKRRQPCVPMSS